MAYINGNNILFSGGVKGDAGVSPTVSVADITGGHRVTINYDAGEVSFDVMDGATGERGADGTNGKDGRNGEDGYSPVIETSKNGKTTTIKLTDLNGDKYAYIVDGTDGTNGKNGEDGYSPTIATSKANGVTTITLTDLNGTKVATILDGSTGEKGKDGTNGKDGHTPTDAEIKALIFTYLNESYFTKGY
jgi:hypothetical protein